MIYYGRKLELELYKTPDGSVALRPVYCREWVSGPETESFFQTDTNQDPPSTSELLSRYSALFVGHIKTWISEYTKYLWRRRVKSEIREDEQADSAQQNNSRDIC